MSSARESHTATTLTTGSVLMAGGLLNGTPLGTGEIYIASTTAGTAGSFQPASGLMVKARGYHTATLMNTGVVLLTGGLSPTGVTNSTEQFSPITNLFTQAGDNLTTAREKHTATLMADDLHVLVTGGDNGTSSLSSAEKSTIFP
jgi:hypothetical protein